MRAITISIAGVVPAPKGSMRAAGNRVIPSGSKQNAANLAAWSQAVRNAAVTAVAREGFEGRVMFIDVPIRFSCEFRMPRLKSHFVKKGPDAGSLIPGAPKWHRGKPDKDKLIRTTWDALTGVVIDDDSRFAETFVRKIYAQPGHEGAWMKIEEL